MLWKHYPKCNMCVILNNDRNPQAYRSQSNGRQGGGRNYWEHEAEHLSTLVTSATRPPPDPESSLRRLRQLADSKQLTITPVKLILREHKYRKELLVTNVTNGVREVDNVYWQNIPWISPIYLITGWGQENILWTLSNSLRFKKYIGELSISRTLSYLSYN